MNSVTLESIYHDALMGALNLKSGDKLIWICGHGHVTREDWLSPVDVKNGVDPRPKAIKYQRAEWVGDVFMKGYRPCDLDPTMQTTIAISPGQMSPAPEGNITARRRTDHGGWDVTLTEIPIALLLNPTGHYQRLLQAKADSEAAFATNMADIARDPKALASFMGVTSRNPEALAAFMAATARNAT